MPLVRSAIRPATRTGRGFATPCGGMAEPRPQRVVMDGRRDGQHVIFISLLAVGREPLGFARHPLYPVSSVTVLCRSEEVR